MDDYVVLDLETPNRMANSMSSMGIVIVENGEVTDEVYTLINPEAEFDDFNIAFTGIHPEDVEDAPIFPEFYREIKNLLKTNVIVGQNITFDLGVISRSLTRYNMPIPPFTYYCTLRSCKRNLNLPENSLSYIVYNVLNTTYDAHNAMEDARMTNQLYNYLSDYEDNRDDYLKTYYYRPNCKRDFNRSFDYNYNYLYGLTKKFNYVTKITENHRNLLETWLESNKCNNAHPLIENIMLKVKYMIDDKPNTEELKQINTSLNPIKRSPEYKVIKLKQQVLKGMLDSIICEYEVTTDDIEYLKNWLNENKINDKEHKTFMKTLEWEDKDKLFKQLETYAEYLENNI